MVTTKSFRRIQASNTTWKPAVFDVVTFGAARNTDKTPLGNSLVGTQNISDSSAVVATKISASAPIWLQLPVLQPALVVGRNFRSTFYRGMKEKP